MKAAEWYAKLKAAETDEDLERVLVNCLKSLVQDADKLIKIRRATSDDAVSKCIQQVDNTWRAIINCRNKDKNIDLDTPISRAKFLDDGFKAAYIQIHPKRGWMFDLNHHKKCIEYLQADFEKEQLKERENVDITDPILIMYGLTPYNKITEYNADSFMSDVLTGCMALSNILHDESIPNTVKYVYINTIRKYILHLRIWVEIGKYDPKIIEMDIRDITPYIYKTYGVAVNFG